jgi:hypothetical protein
LHKTQCAAMTEYTPKALNNIAQGRDSAPWDCGSDSGPQTPTGFYKWRAGDMGPDSRTPKGLSNRAAAPMWNPVGVRARWVGGPRSQGALPRPWALMWNPVGVRARWVGRTAFPGCAGATLGFDVEPRWGSGAAGLGGPRSQGALARPWALLWNPVGVRARWVGGPRSQGALARPWALLWNRFAVRNPTDEDSSACF